MAIVTESSLNSTISLPPHTPLKESKRWHALVFLIMILVAIGLIVFLTRLLKWRYERDLKDSDYGTQQTPQAPISVRQESRKNGVKSKSSS